MVTKSNPMNLKTAKPIAESLRSLGLFMEAAKLEEGGYFERMLHSGNR